MKYYESNALRKTNWFEHSAKQEWLGIEDQNSAATPPCHLQCIPTTADSATELPKEVQEKLVGDSTEVAGVIQSVGDGGEGICTLTRPFFRETPGRRRLLGKTAERKWTLTSLKILGTTGKVFSPEVAANPRTNAIEMDINCDDGWCGAPENGKIDFTINVADSLQGSASLAFCEMGWNKFYGVGRASRYHYAQLEVSSIDRQLSL